MLVIRPVKLETTMSAEVSKKNAAKYLAKKNGGEGNIVQTIQ